MTFSLPAGLAAQFLRRVSSRDRSRYVAEALATKLKERDRLLARAADVANRSRAVRKLERDWGGLPDEIAEPWDDAPAR